MPDKKREPVEVISDTRDSGSVTIKMLWYPDDKIVVFTKTWVDDIPIELELGGFTRQHQERYVASNPTAQQTLSLWKLLVPTRAMSLRAWREMIKVKVTTDANMLRR